MASTAAFKEQRRDDRDLAVQGVDPAQSHDADDTGKDEEPAGDDRAGPAVHQPAHVYLKLMRLRSREQHAIAEQVQETRLADPLFFIDDDAVHDRDLSGRAAEAQRGYP
jgi:hypothetical protein